MQHLISTGVYLGLLQDVSSKIMSFSQNGPRAVCILSANGAISNVTLRQPAISGGTVTYEVCEITKMILLNEIFPIRSPPSKLFEQS